MSLIVLEPGLDSRIVDLGRPRTRSLGVPIGGAADRRSLMLGNALIGNPPDAAALEIALKGPRLQVNAEVACAIFGGTVEVRWYGAWETYEARDCAFTVPPSRQFGLERVTKGARAYLCVRGGFQTPVILGSRSSLEPVAKGDNLPCASTRIQGRWCPALQAQFPQVRTVAVLPGLQSLGFDENEFYNQIFTVTPAINRMGMRLQGKPLTMPKREIPSEPVCPGAVQVTNDGQCIILGVDGQTIGGYPKIAQVIQADLGVLGQLGPGVKVRFERITMEEAVRRDRAVQAELRMWMLRLSLSLDAFPAARRFASS